MTVTTYEHAPDEAVTSFVRWVEILRPANALAERIAGTEFVPAAMRDKPDVVTAAIMYGDEIGLGPMQALASINVIEGRPAPSSELMRALIFRAGHALGVEFLSGTRCVVWGRRAGQPDVTRIEWSLEMARTAGLTDGKRGYNWRRYPRAMLLARASSELARVLFPDVIKGLSHIADDDDSAEGFAAWADTVPAGEDAPIRKTVRRRTETTRAPALEAPVTPSSATGEATTPKRDDDPAETHTDAPTEDAPAPGTPPASDLPPARTGDGSGEAFPPPPPLPDPYDGQDPWTTEPAPETPLPPVDDSAPDDGKASDRLLRAIFAQLTKVSPEAANDDALRHTIATGILGRGVDSFSTLTKREGLRMVGVLSDIETGALGMEVSADRRTVRIYATGGTEHGYRE